MMLEKQVSISASATVSVARSAGCQWGSVVAKAVIAKKPVLRVVQSTAPPIVEIHDIDITFVRVVSGTGRLLDAGMKESQSPPAMRRICGT